MEKIKLKRPNLTSMRQITLMPHQLDLMNFLLPKCNFDMGCEEGILIDDNGVASGKTFLGLAWIANSCCSIANIRALVVTTNVNFSIGRIQDMLTNFGLVLDVNYSIFKQHSEDRVTFWNGSSIYIVNTSNIEQRLCGSEFTIAFCDNYYSEDDICPPNFIFSRLRYRVHETFGERKMLIN